MKILFTKLTHTVSSLRSFFGPMLQSFCWINSPFFNRISIVISSSTYKQMPRIATRRVVACVTNIHTFRYSSIYKLISKSMCSEMFFNAAGSDGKFTVPVFIFTSSPFPTFVGKNAFYYFRPESLHNKSVTQIDYGVNCGF